MQKRKKKKYLFCSAAPASSFFVSFLPHPKDVILVTFRFPLKAWIVVDFDTHYMATVDILIIRGVVEEKRTNGEEEELVPGAGRCVELIHQGSGRFVRLQLHKKKKKKEPQLYVSRRISRRFEACHERRAVNNTADGRPTM